MTCRADAHLDDVLAIRHHSQLRVECSHTDELCAVNLRTLIQPVERIGRQVIELLLNSLQQWDDLFSSSANSVNDGICISLHHLFFHISYIYRPKA